MSNRDYGDLRREELIELLRDRDADEAGGLRLHYKGQTPPWRIVRRVQPRRQKIEQKLSFGPEEDQASNLIVEGDNLHAMVSLYKYRGQADLILTDPPYNTGLDFRYNDKWDDDPNDPDLGSLVPADDGSRHSKWLRFMVPRLWAMREMLRPGGVLAICIDQRELFRLGLVLDEMFGESNRIGIINWQKNYSPRSDNKHLSSATEYVLVYAKNLDRTTTSLLPRTEAMNARYTSVDGDPEPWKGGDISGPGAETHQGMVYAIQSPFTGQLHYPPEGACWRFEKPRMKEWLKEWGVNYVERDLNDGKAEALLIKNAPLPGTPTFSATNKALKAARAAAQKRLTSGPWPQAYWNAGGEGGLAYKRYLKSVKQGFVPTTFWSNEDLDDPTDIGAVSWVHQQSGHSQTGVNELSGIMGRGHGFDTVKPLKLFKKIIQIWCPPSGIVFDPFAGSGTTGHAVLELNLESPATRRFVLVEQGRPEKGDSYARTLTVERVRRAITGERVDKEGTIAVSATPLPGGFRFSKLISKVDAAAVLALEREEMLDLLLTTHWDQGERGAVHLRRLPAGQHAYLFAVGARGEGFFLIWSGPDKPSVLDRPAFRGIVEEAKAEKLSPPYHVYARTAIYPGPNIEFYQIPDRILEKLGFNETVQPYTERSSIEDAAA